MNDRVKNVRKLPKKRKFRQNMALMITVVPRTPIEGMKLIFHAVKNFVKLPSNDNFFIKYDSNQFNYLGGMFSRKFLGHCFVMPIS